MSWLIMDAVQQLARPCEAVLQRFHVDTRYIAAGAPADWKGGIVQNRRDGRLWHDLTDEFGVNLVDARRPSVLHGYLRITPWPTRRSTTSGPIRFPRATTPTGLPACGSGPSSCATRRPTRWSAAFRAWSTRSAGTCAGWSSGLPIC